ncbi:MAG: hypothetical protein KF745_11600 [Phycisphaeraceae bacterium]|nr:hypothetical protein [Phycisphaeraceae bacterium]
MSMNATTAAALVAALALAGSAQAVINPFTEPFNSAANNWSVGSVLTPLNYFPSGGPDGSAYGSTDVSLASAIVGDQPLLFRAQSNFNSSNNAFVGDWLASGVTELTFSLRHNGPVPVTFYTRFAPAAGPGAVAVLPTAVQPNEWTTLSVAINPATPFIYEGTTFAGTFASVARLQFGLMVDAGLAGQSAPLTVDIDNVGIVPAPAAGVLFGVAGLFGCRRRRG